MCIAGECTPLLYINTENNYGSLIITMMKGIFTTTFFLLFTHYIFAQEQIIHPKWKFHSINQIGLLQGENLSAFHVQSINGFQKNNWFSGIGLGLDYYKFKSIPLFAEIRKYFGTSRNQFFLYADGGANFVWEKKDKGDGDIKNFHPGLYSNTGLGYKAGLKNGMAFILSAGYSYKKINEKDDEQIFCPFTGPCYTQLNKYNYDLSRLIIQIGWMF
jgi:hypothetical protein